MKENEILEMQRLIDEGVRLAQVRLWQRAGVEHQPLVVYRGGKILEMVPEVEDDVTDCYNGDPLAHRKTIMQGS